jgi:hypothetical protein
MPSLHGPMLLRIHWFLCGVLAVSTAAPSAPAGPHGREARSANGQWSVRVERGDGRERPPTATFRQTAARTSENAVWTAKLVNHRAPEHLFVSDDGAHVVTLDEYRYGGALHAIVLYDGRDGALRGEWSLLNLFTANDWRHAELRPRHIEWLRRAETRFIDADAAFEIRLRWGRTIRIDLKRGQIADLPPGAGPDAAPREVRALFAELAPLVRGLDSTSQPADSADGPPGLDPQLAILLAIEAAQAAAAQQPALLDAEQLLREQILAAAMLPLIEDELDDDAEASMDSTDEADAAMTAETTSIPAVADLPSAAQTADDEAVAQARAQAVAATGIVVPLPDPAHPVDYIAWTREMTVGGEEGRATMDRAIALYQHPDPPPPALEQAVATGDPGALNDPAVLAYREANAAALAEFRAFAHQPYRGPDIRSDDGSMIGIMLPHLSAMRRLAKLSVIEAHALSHEGRLGEAAALLSDALHAGANIGQGPTMIESLVGTAIQTLASDALLDIAARMESAPSADFTRVAEILAQARATTRPMSETMQFERAMMLDTLQRTFAYDAETKQYVPRVEGMLKLMAELQPLTDASPVKNALALASLDFHATVAATNAYYDEVTLATSLPYAQREAIQARHEAAMKHIESNPIVRDLAPVADRASFVQTRGEASRRAAILVQQLQAHRQRTGSYPEDLRAFGDTTIVTDPFSGAPFRYERRPDGTFRLYTVGGDLADQGGVHDPSGQSGDLVFWPRPQKPH